MNSPFCWSWNHMTSLCFWDYLGLDHILTIMFHSISLGLPPFLAPFPWFTQPPEPWRCLRSWRVAPIATPARGWLRSVRNWIYRGGSWATAMGFLQILQVYNGWYDFIWILYGFYMDDMILYDLSPHSQCPRMIWMELLREEGPPWYLNVFDGILPCSKAIVFDSLRRFSHRRWCAGSDWMATLIHREGNFEMWTPGGKSAKGWPYQRRMLAVKIESCHIDDWCICISSERRWNLSCRTAHAQKYKHINKTPQSNHQVTLTTPASMSQSPGLHFFFIQ